METKLRINELVRINMSDEAKKMLETDGFQLTMQISDLKVTNKETYDRACELGVWNASVLKKLDDLRKAIVKPLDIQKKKINESFEQAKELFSENDERVRKMLLAYQNGKKKLEDIKTVHTDLGRATIQERKDYVIEDASQVPEQYWKLDESKIGKVIRAGGEIPGVKVITKKSTAFVAA